MSTRLCVLGEIRMWIDGQPASLGHARQRCVLAALAVDADQLVPTEQLVDRVWGDRTPGDARSVLYNYVARLRRVLAASRDVTIDRRPGGYVLAVDPSTVDLHRFRELIGQARSAGDDEALVLFSQALDLWRGQPFAGLDNEWLDAVRTALAAERLAAELEYTELRLRRGQHTRLLPEVTARAAAHPFDERATAQLMMALHRAGRPADALRHYQDLRRRLVTELGTEPGPDLRRLHQRILTDDPDPTGRTAPATTAVDVSPQRFPPSAMFSLRGDIPQFVGREEELRNLLDTVASAADRAHGIAVHTVDGMAGVGKTTFSVHAAHHLADRFPDGQIFLELYGHSPTHYPRDPADALASLLVATGMDRKHLPRELDDRARLWRDRIAGRKVLLVLDDAASHDQLRPLLPGTPECFVVITSRHRLSGLDGARTVTLDVLPPNEAAHMLRTLGHRDPAPTTPVDSPSDSDAAARVVRSCGHLPLAIALAAGRLRSHPTWSVTYLADLLAEAPDRLQQLAVGDRSLRAAFTVSYHNLSPERQWIFSLLGVHPGPTIDAYALAALADCSVAQAHHHLEALHADHLIHEIAPGRYQLHDLLRDYAASLAVTADTAETGQAMRRVLRYYLNTAATAAAHIPAYVSPTPMITPDAMADHPRVDSRQQARNWLDTELATLATCIERTTDDPDLTIALAATLASYLRVSGAWEEGYRIHHAALAATERTRDRLGHATTLRNLGLAYRLRGDWALAQKAFEQAHQVFTDLSDRHGQATTLLNLGVVHRLRGDQALAQKAFDQAHQVFTDLGDRHEEATALLNLGVVHRLRGDWAQAEQALDEAHRLYIELGDPLGQAAVLLNLGYVYRLRGDWAQAEHTVDQAHRRYTELGDRHGQATALRNLGCVYHLRGEWAPARQAFEQAHQVFTELGDRHGQATTLLNLGVVHRLRGDWAQAEHALDRAHQVFTELGDRHGQADSRLNLGRVHHQTGGYAKALDLLTTAYSLFTDVDDPDGQVETLNGIGNLALDHPPAGDPHALFTQAHSLARTIGAALHVADALAGLGRCADRRRDMATAVAAFEEALAIYQRLGSPDSAAVTHRLADLRHDID